MNRYYLNSNWFLELMLAQFLRISLAHLHGMSELRYHCNPRDTCQSSDICWTFLSVQQGWREPGVVGSSAGLWVSKKKKLHHVQQAALERAAVVQTAFCSCWHTANSDPQTGWQLEGAFFLLSVERMLVLSDLPGLENLGSAKSVVRRAPRITGGRFRS